MIRCYLVVTVSEAHVDRLFMSLSVSCLYCIRICYLYLYGNLSVKEPPPDSTPGLHRGSPLHRVRRRLSLTGAGSE